MFLFRWTPTNTIKPHVSRTCKWLVEKVFKSDNQMHLMAPDFVAKIESFIGKNINKRNIWD